MDPDKPGEHTGTPNESPSDRFVAGFFRVAGAVMLVVASHALLRATLYEGLLWIDGALFCFGTSFDPSNVIRALIGRVDLLGGRLRMGRFGKGLLYMSFACGVLAVIFRQYLT